MKYLTKYYEWAEAGKLPMRGLCSCLCDGDLSLLDLFSLHDGSYWAHEEGPEYERLGFPNSMANEVRYTFTPLRQNIVLFMAAMNQEL